ncbi:YraN family protein [Candidatus Nomurabacteria bacterium]|nr:YraN family protein [Candidatus Nomurabacteria bacterium]
MIRIFTSKTQKFGEKGEDEAVTFLKKNGYKIIERNVANVRGEIDIVAQKDKTTYFFEVKTGREGSAVSPAENLHPAKLKKFLYSAELYRLSHRIDGYRVQGIIVLQKADGTYAMEILDIF